MILLFFVVNYELKYIVDSELLFIVLIYIDNINFIYNGVVYIDVVYGGGDSIVFIIFKE